MTVIASPPSVTIILQLRIWSTVGSLLRLVFKLAREKSPVHNPHNTFYRQISFSFKSWVVLHISHIPQTFFFFFPKRSMKSEQKTVRCWHWRCTVLVKLLLGPSNWSVITRNIVTAVAIGSSCPRVLHDMNSLLWRFWAANTFRIYLGKKKKKKNLSWYDWKLDLCLSRPWNSMIFQFQVLWLLIGIAWLCHLLKVILCKCSLSSVLSYYFCLEPQLNFWQMLFCPPLKFWKFS